MGLLGGRVSNSERGGRHNIQTPKKLAYVYDVILDETHPYAVSNKLGSSAVGAVKFRTADSKLDDASLPIAYPIDKAFKHLPIKNELVEIYDAGDSISLYRRISVGVNPSVSASPDSISNANQKETEESNTSGTYSNVSQTGIARSSQNSSDEYNGFGNYYLPQSNIHNLKLYEGDTLIESRFGQSIRFSGFNNSTKVFSPTLIIRNGETSVKSSNIPDTSVVEEDINRDGSTIAMTSDKYQLSFQPGTVDDKGKSDFETKPDSFADFPSKLIGDNILINSGRIILSAKNAEMIFFSKKNYGFISDGGMSIDNKLGIDISVGDNINMITNNNDIVMYTGNGSIFLGNTELEPLVKGQQLVDILSELIDAITVQTFLTPSGPTAVGPTNIGDFGGIKSKLNNILSKLNQTS